MAKKQQQHCFIALFRDRMIVYTGRNTKNNNTKRCSLILPSLSSYILADSILINNKNKLIIASATFFYSVFLMNEIYILLYCK
jgi:hypothetical protein